MNTPMPSSSARGSSSRPSRRRLTDGAGLSGRVIETVAKAAHGADRRAAAELGAQARDIDLDRVRADVLVPIRDRLQQAVLRDHATDVQRQAFEHCPFAPGQADRLALYFDASR